MRSPLLLCAHRPFYSHSCDSHFECTQLFTKLCAPPSTHSAVCPLLYTRQLAHPGQACLTAHPRLHTDARLLACMYTRIHVGLAQTVHTQFIYLRSFLVLRSLNIRGITGYLSEGSLSKSPCLLPF